MNRKLTCRLTHNRAEFEDQFNQEPHLKRPQKVCRGAIWTLDEIEHLRNMDAPSAPKSEQKQDCMEAPN